MIGSLFAKNRGSDSVLRRTWILTAIWSMLIAASLAWNVERQRDQTAELSTREARAHFNKDQAFRFWATRHGGVYVPIDERTPPNPYLTHIPNRVVTTTDGQSLTLMNPAYMLHQMMDEFSELYGVKGRITSLNPLNPENAPDAWERAALLAFEKGTKEVFEATDLQGRPYLRLIQPMVTREGCLKCHEHQGYQIGDVRGGVEVSIPLGPYLDNERKIIHNLALSHGGLWLLGLSAVVALGRRDRRHLELEHTFAKRLQERGERLAEAQRIAHIGHWDLDLVSHQLTWSDEVFRIFEFDPLTFEPSYEGFLSRIHPDDRELVGKAYSESVSSRSGYDIVHRLLLPGERLKWVHERGRTVYGADQQPLRSIGTVQDVSEKHTAEAALRVSEQRWIMALDGAGHGVWDWNLKTNRVFYSARWWEMFGFAADEVADGLDEWKKRVHPDDLEASLAAVGAHFRGETPYYRHTHRMRHKDGGYRWILDRGMVWERNPDGSPLRVVGTHTDVTHQKELEMELQRERGLFVAGPTVVFRWTATSEWPVAYVSPNLRAVFGYDPADLLSGRLNFAELIHPEDKQRIEDEVAKHVASGGGHFEQRYRLRHKDGSWRWIYDLTLPERDADGRVTHFHGYCLDISAQKRNEEALEQARDQAQAANLAKSRFLANVSHDLRTPLNSLLILARSLERNEPGNLLPEQIESARIIGESGHRLLDLINDLLDLSQFDAGRRGTLDLSAVDPREAARLLHRRFMPLAQKKGLRLELQLEDGLPARISSDPGKLDRILSNLLANAVKFTAQGGVRLRVYPTTAATSDTVSGIAFEVVDSGSGIAAHLQDKVFEAFAQPSPSALHPGGSGLGLAIARALCRLLGGQLELDSAPGQGTRFTLRLPLDAPEAAGTGTIQPAPATRSQEPEPAASRPMVLDTETVQPDPRWRNFGILIVDTDMRWVLALARALRRRGLRVFPSADTQHARHLLEAEPQIQAVVVGARLSADDHCEALRRLRELPTDGRIQWFTVADPASPATHRDCLEAGARDTLSAPVDVERLCALLLDARNEPARTPAAS